jgi:Tfp pilus assembly protein FimV
VKTKYGMLLMAALLSSACMVQALAESKRVHVYPLTQQYWDVQTGETLSDIAAALLPGASQHRQRLINDIAELNPDAFIGGDPDRLLANQRLWLPNTITRPASQQNAEIQEFTWGYIKRQK